MIIRKHRAGDMRLGTSTQGFDTVSGVTHTIAKADSRLRFWKGEFFADQRLGVPYRQAILGRKVPASIVQGIMHDALTITAGIDRVLSVEVALDAPSRGMSVLWVARAVDGTVLSSRPFIVGNARK